MERSIYGMDQYIKGNRDHWDEVTPIHVRSAFYDVEGFKKGRSSLKPIEEQELGDVAGKTVLHLQCHFGLDTLSLARQGAKVTGVDFSGAAITQAQFLSYETGIPAIFVCSNIYELPNVLDQQYDIVFTSYGVLTWLPDVDRWAQVIARYVKPGGVFYMAEVHPFTHVFYNEDDAADLRVAYSYFHDPEPQRWEPHGSYADPSAELVHPVYEWNHSLSDIVNALIKAGLTLEFVHEFPVTVFQQFPFMEQDAQGMWRLKEKDNTIPLIFSLRATKAG